MIQILADTLMMLGILMAYAGISVALSVAGVAAYMKWVERRG